MASPRQNYKTINVLYSHNNQQESHPVKFYNEMDINDVDFMIKETVESLKNHMNQPDLKVWCPHKGTEINYQVEPLHVYNDILISDSKPVTHHNVRSNLPVQEEPEPQPVIQPADVQMTISRTGEGPIVRDCILKEESSQSISMDKSKEKPKSAAKSLLLSRDPSKAENKTWETEDSKHLAQSARVQGNVNREPYNGTFEPINNQHSLANKEYMSPNTQTPVKEQVYTRPEQHDISYSPNQVNNSQAKTESLKKANPPPRMGMEEDIPNTTTALVPKKVIAKPPTGTIGTVPLDGNDPNIYSTRTSIMPFSYMITVMDQKYNDKLPPPLYLPYEVLAEKKSFAKDDVLRGLEITSVGELKLVDPEILQNQKGLIKEVLQSLMKSIAEGRGVVGVSLPIRIFEPRSLIERICDFWTFVPKRIIPAAQTTDPVIRMKKVIAMIIGGLHLSAKQTKPFNPLLGETYQAVFPDDGITIDLEHTSHHPPIANYLLTHKDFRIWGRYEFIAKLEGLTKNTVIMLQKGTCHLDFADGHKLQYWCPHLHLEGMMHGDRTAKFVGNLKIVDEKNKLKTVVKFGSSGEHKAFPKKRTDAFNGKIYRYKDGALKSKDDDLHFADLESNICDVYGSWLEYLNIGGEVEWDITRDMPTQFFPVKDPLPSDARYREDLIWIKRNNKKFGQEWKLLLEVRQRAEKKLRQDGLRARRHPTK